MQRRDRADQLHGPRAHRESSFRRSLRLEGANGRLRGDVGPVLAVRARRAQRLSENFPPRESRNLREQGSSETAPERAVRQAGACSFPVVVPLLDKTFINLGLNSQCSWRISFGISTIQHEGHQLTMNWFRGVCLLLTLRFSCELSCHLLSIVQAVILVLIKGSGAHIPVRNLLGGYLRQCACLGGEYRAGLLCISLLSAAVGCFCRPCRDQSCR